MADATIRVAITSDNSDLQRGLAESESKLASFGKSVAKVSGAAALAVGAGVLALSKVSVQAASDAQQSLGATETVFGKFADRVVKESNRAAEAFGLSANDYRENANVLGALLGNQGVAQDKLAGKTRSLITTASDLAATFGGPTSDAVEALASAFKGEFDPLEKYGVSIKQSTINTEAYRLANVKTKAAFDELTSSQQAAYKQQATSNLLMKQTAKSQGAFARETDTLAHQQQVLGAQWTDLKVKIGNALLPAVTNVFDALTSKLMPALSDLADRYLPAVRRALDEWTKDFDPDEFLTNVGNAIRGVDWASVSSGASDLGDAFRKLGPALKGVSVDTFNDSLRVFGTVVGFAADHVDELAAAMPYLVAAFVAFKGAQLVNQTVGSQSLVGLAAQLYATRQLTTANRELAAAVRGVAGAQAAGTFGTVGSAAGQAATKLDSLKTAAQGAAGLVGLGLLTAGAYESNDALSTLELTAGGIATGFAVGGPVGAAIGGVAGLLGGLVFKFDDAGNAGQDAYRQIAAVDPIETADKAMSDLKDSLDQVTGAYTENTRAAVLAKLQASGQIGIAEKYGISARTVVNAALGQGDAFRQINPLIADYHQQIKDADAALVDITTNSDNFTDTGLSKAAQEDANAITAQKKAAQSAIAELRRMPGALREDAREIQATTAVTTDYGNKLRSLPRRVRTAIEATGIVPTVKGIAELAKRYKLTPKQIKTVIEASGVDTTVKQVRHVRDEMVKTGNTRVDGSAYKGSISQITREAAAIARTGGASVGSALKSGTEAGLSGLGTSLANSVTAAVNQAIAAGHHAADSHSPSRKMMRLGQQMGEGLVVGIDSLARSYAVAGANAVDTVGAGARSRAGSGGGGGGGSDYRRELQPRQTPVKVYLDGQEIADHLELRVGRLATATSLRRRA